MRRSSCCTNDMSKEKEEILVEITGTDVKAFWQYMSKEYDFEIVTKKDAAEMKVVGWFLDRMNIQKKSVFMERYTTTICLGPWRCVYVPFEIGTGDQKELISQIVICAHECQHVVQADREPAQPMKYLLSDASRAYYEADAYRVNLELHWFFTKRLLSAEKLASKLRHYSIGAADRRIAEKHLVIAAKVVKRGGVITGVSKETIAWWKEKDVSKVPLIKIVPIDLSPFK